MTFSIVGRSGGELGVAVASKFLAAGALVPAVDAGAGALASQAFSNQSYRPDGLALLREGRSADETVATLTGADELREHRQLGVVALSGPGANFTGEKCLQWAGGCAGDGYAIQGNILAGQEVVAEMERAWLAGGAQPLARRLLAALVAGDSAGGDRRGRQSAALVVASPGAGYGGYDIAADLRVDDHAAPVGELRRLLELHEFYFGRPDLSSAVTLEGSVLEEVRGLLTSVGYPPAGGGAGGEAVEVALAEWASMENLEMRYAGGGLLDKLVLDFLRRRSAESP